MEKIYKQLCDSLDKLGVKEIEALHAPFDPNLHHAVQQIARDDLGENHRRRGLPKGFLLGRQGDPLRHGLCGKLFVDR